MVEEEIVTYLKIVHNISMYFVVLHGETHLNRMI